MASMRDIKRRKESIQSTEQITKAMKLVATVKLQKSRIKADQSRPYFSMMKETVESILQRSVGVNHRFLQPAVSSEKAVVAITSNRGLAGGYNNQVVKLVIGSDCLPVSHTLVYAIGRKGRDTFKRRGYQIGGDYSDVVNEPAYQDAVRLTEDLLEAYENHKFGEIYLAYTSFQNTVTHSPVLIKLLPVDVEMTAAGDKAGVMEYEPEEEEVLDYLIPQYISSMIYGGLLEALASEHGARMTAMESASRNAEEMIEELALQYNRARQGAITQELTEIIAGANAIS